MCSLKRLRSSQKQISLTARCFDDPRYSEFEYALPDYRKKMEERFPQVCDICAPAVDDRIRSTGYAAKTDHLRRMMDQTRGKGIIRKSWSWKNFVVLLGGIGWSVSLAGHLALHVLEALPTTETDHGLSDPDDIQPTLLCFVQGAYDLEYPPSCSQRFHAILGYCLGLSLLCCWWNPKMQYKLSGGHGRVVGRVDYYKLQMMALAIRFVTWKLAVTESTFAIEPQSARAIHAFGLVLEILLSILSLRTVQIDRRPQVSFQEEYEPMVPGRSMPQKTPALQQNSRDLSPLSRSHVQRFPIEKLASKTLTPQQLPYQPPTPPPEEDDADTGMDWTPQHNFRPAKTYNILQAQPTFNEPSPFHGALPPAPVSWAQRLRNPAQPPFHKASDEKKENFFGQKSSRMLSDDISDVSSRISPKSPSFMSGIGSPVKFAPPRFFAPVDRMETGLESLFEDAFTLSKDTKTLKDQNVRHYPEPEVSSLATSPLTRLVTTSFLSMSCVAWEVAATLLPSSAPTVRMGCQLVAATISSLNAASSAALPRTTRSIGSALFYGVEAIAAAALGGLIWQPFSYGGQVDCRALGLWFLIGLTVQEVWDLFSSLLLPAPSITAQSSVNRERTYQDTTAHKPAVQQQQALRSEPRQNPFNQAPKMNRATALSSNAKLNGVQMSQRTARSKTRDEGRRDSLGVNGLGSLSLGGW
ncbi:MAG: hypothetical protein Q9171_004973 [Xanthocarpia ochracea]